MKPIGRTVPGRLQLALALAIVALGGGCLDTVVPAPVDSRSVLSRFYNMVNGSDWIRSDNWGTDAPLGDWHGVTTDSEGNVTGLRLGVNRLQGEIPEEIGSLESLEVLDLGGNILTGSIPAALGNLENLQVLDLSHNRLTRSIPPELGNLESLRTMNLGGNLLWGSIPPELGNLRVEILDLSYNGLTGPIPPELGNLENLAFLWMAGNELTGPIPPELGNLGNLEGLHLTRNALTGPIPPELADLERLNTLGLGHNDLTGPVPPEFGNLLALNALWIDATALSGGLPLELADLPLWLFHWNRTDLCAPSDEHFRDWLRSIGDHQWGGDCTPEQGRSKAWAPAESIPGARSRHRAGTGAFVHGLVRSAPPRSPPS